MLDALEMPNAEVAGPHLGALNEDCRALAPSYATEAAPSHLECLHLGAGFPSREAIATLRGAGVSQATLIAHSVTETTVKFFPKRRWDSDPAGTASLLLAARNGFGEVVDVIAWPIHQPDKWARLTGRAVMLGEEELNTPTMGDPVPAWRTPLNWLAAGATGIVVLDPAAAWRTLHSGPPLSGEDLAHAKDIRALLAPPDVTPRVYVRSTKVRKAA